MFLAFDHILAILQELRGEWEARNTSHLNSPAFAFTICSISSIAASVASWTTRCEPRPEASICLRACCRIERMAILASSPSFLTWRAVFHAARR